jgi:hypothetical protein
MNKLILIGLAVSVLAGCDDFPLRGIGIEGGDDFAETSQHKYPGYNQHHPAQSVLQDDDNSRR